MIDMETSVLPDLIRIADTVLSDTHEYLRDRLMDVIEDRWNEIFNNFIWQADRATEDNLWHLAQDYKYKLRDAIEQVLVSSLERTDLDERMALALGEILEIFAWEAKALIDG